MTITNDEAWELAQPLGGGGFKYADAQGGLTHKFAMAVIEWHKARVLAVIADTKEHVAQRGNWTAENACERIEELVLEL